jgi:hypothetical protein
MCIGSSDPEGVASWQQAALHDVIATVCHRCKAHIMHSVHCDM